MFTELQSHKINKLRRPLSNAELREVEGAITDAQDGFCEIRTGLLEQLYSQSLLMAIKAKQGGLNA